MGFYERQALTEQLGHETKRKGDLEVSVFNEGNQRLTRLKEKIDVLHRLLRLGKV